MIDFSSIAIFILATTALNTRFSPQEYKTYYESRILPIHETWGSFFPHIYFVFGTNTFDYQFLKQRCQHVREHDPDEIIQSKTVVHHHIHDSDVHNITAPLTHERRRKKGPVPKVTPKVSRRLHASIESFV